MATRVKKSSARSFKMKISTVQLAPTFLHGQLAGRAAIDTRVHLAGKAMGHPSVGPQRLTRSVSAATQTSSHSVTAAAALAPCLLACVSAARSVGLRVRYKKEE